MKWIEQQNISSGQASAQLDMKDVFYDPEGDAIGYQLQDSYPEGAVEKLEVNGDQVTVVFSPSASGQVWVRIRATDGISRAKRDFDHVGVFLNRE